jgi:hypothetical protein
MVGWWYHRIRKPTGMGSVSVVSPAVRRQKEEEMGWSEHQGSRRRGGDGLGSLSRQQEGEEDAIVIAGKPPTESEPARCGGGGGPIWVGVGLPKKNTGKEGCRLFKRSECVGFKDFTHLAPAL